MSSAGAPKLRRAAGAVPRRFSPLVARWVSAICVAGILTAAPAPAASAATLSWGTSGTGGDGTWDTTTGNWWNGSDVAWNNSASDDAVFGGTPGTVTLTTSNTANALTFDAFTGLYTLALNGQTLAIGGDGLTMNAGAGNATLSGAGTVLLTATQAWTNNSTNLLTVSSTVDNNGNRLTIGGSGSTSISGILSGSGGLTKSGTATLTLSGNNSYSGGTTVTEGTLRLSHTNAAGSEAVALAGGTLSLFRSDATTTYGNAITVANAQAGTLRVDGSGSNAGTGANSTYNTGTITANGTLTIARTSGGTGNTVFNGVLAGSGTLVVDNTNGGVNPVSGTSTGRASFNSTSNTFSGDVVIRNGGNLLNNTTSPSYRSVDIGSDSLLTLVTAGGNTITTIGTLTGAGTVIKNINSATATLSVGAGNFSGAISSGTLFGGSGSIALTKTGDGTLTLSGNNSYTGTTSINAGTLNVGSANALAGGGHLTFGGGSLQYSASNSADYSARIKSSGSAVAIDTNGRNVAFASVVDNSNTGGLTKLGAGTLTLTGTNTFTGGTIVNAGTLSLGNSPSSGNAIISGGLTINAGATVNASASGWSFGYSTFVSSIAINGGQLNFSNFDSGSGYVGSRIVLAGGTIGGSGFGWARTSPVIQSLANSSRSTIAGPIGLRTGGGTLTFDVARGSTSDGLDLVVSGSLVRYLTETASVVKTGEGTLALTGTNSYTGTTRINVGTLLFVNPASLYGGTTANWTAANITSGSGGTLAVRVGASNFTTGNVTTLLTNLGGLGGAVSNNGLVAGSTIGFDTSNAGGTFTVADAIRNSTGTGGGAIGVAKLGAGTLTFSGSNSYTGPTTVGVGVLRFATLAAGSGTQALGSGSVVNLGVAATSAGELEYFAATSGTLDKNVFALGTDRNRIRNSGAGTLTLSGTLTKNSTILELAGGTFNVTGQITGTLANSDLFINGASATLTNANNDYNGPTYVYGGGTLTLGASNVVPSGSALLLGGTGSDTGTGTIATGTFIDTVASLTTSSLGGTVSITGSGATMGGLTTTGNLAFGAGTDTLALSLTSPTLGRYTLITYQGTRSGTFDSVTGSGNYNVVYGGASNSTIDLQLKANQATSFTLNPASGRVLVGGSTTLSGTLANSSPTGAASLAWNPTVTGSLSGVSSSLGSTIASGSSSAITATFLAGNTAGSQNWSIVNTDNDAITTTSTATGSISVVNQRTFSVSNSGTINLGNFLRTAAVTGSTTISSTGAYATTASATLGSFSGTSTGGFSLGLASGTNVFDGGSATQSAVYSLSGSAASAGAINGSFTSGVSAELGSISPVSVALVGTAYDPATASFASGVTTTSLLVDIGEFNQNTGDHTKGFSIYNLFTDPLFTADLTLLSITDIGTPSNSLSISLSPGSFGALVAGGTSSWLATLTTLTPGSFINQYQLNFASSKDGQSLGGPQSMTLTVTGAIIVPEPGAIALAAVGIGLVGWAAKQRRRRAS